MKKYIWVFSIFLMSINYAQENDFGRLLELFNETSKEIPEDLAFKYFGFEPTEHISNLLTGQLIAQTTSYIVLTTHFNCPSGGVCERSTVSSFNNDGNQISKAVFEQKMADCSFRDARESVYTSENLLVFKETREKLDCLDDGKPLNKKAWLEFQPIKEDGTFGKSYVDRKALQRDNYMFSYKVYNANELEEKTEEELAVIKNEIFAAHGYSFKSKKWQDYFASKSWYEASNQEVVSKLTEIEKKNIALLISLLE